jgi:hypothetical protein
MDGILSKMQQEECFFSQWYKFLLDYDFGVNMPNSSFFFNKLVNILWILCWEHKQ